MGEHLTQNQIEDYCRQQLRVARLLAASEHMRECEACRLRIEGAMSGDEAFFTLRWEVFGQAAELSSPEHLSAEQKGGYVDRSLTSEEDEMASDHLSRCELCAVAVDDLRDFKDQIAPSLDREYRPASLASPTEG